ncbi:phosphate/phosphite/phosphonate ABC transporter substrate-binding protein [bacterium]|nr:phosphate/phosphite/phosphonate ABC transporter substrate-binding protein [bacterium]
MEEFQMLNRFSLSIALSALVASIAHAEEPKVGTRKNPIKLVMVPSTDSTKILSSMKPVAQCLEKETALTFDISVPNSYIVAIEGMGSKKVDIAFLPTFGYLLAHEKYGAEALLKASRHGETTYRSAILARTDKNIKTVNDLNGKKIAYVDPASTSGYILPKKLFLDSKVKPSQEVFQGKHDAVVTAVYQGQVDAGAVFYNKPVDGKIKDAREKVKTQFPDIEEKVKIVTLTEDIPNDPVVIRKEIPAESKAKIAKAFQTCVGKLPDAFRGINNSDAFAEVKDSDYDGIRKTVKLLGINIGTEIDKKK